MSHQLPSPAGGAHLRVVAMPRDANPSGDIFGGWTVSQMDLAGATFAVSHSGLRVVTVRIEAVEFLRPVSVGDDVSVFCRLEEEGKSSIKVHIECWARERGTGDGHKVTEGVFTYVAVDDNGKPRRIEH
jgi:acyl-CoA thioesterase YciA